MTNATRFVSGKMVKESKAKKIFVTMKSIPKSSLANTPKTLKAPAKPTQFGITINDVTFTLTKAESTVHAPWDRESVTQAYTLHVIHNKTNNSMAYTYFSSVAVASTMLAYFAVESLLQDAAEGLMSFSDFCKTANVSGKEAQQMHTQLKDLAKDVTRLIPDPKQFFFQVSSAHDRYLVQREQEEAQRHNQQKEKEESKPVSDVKTISNGHWEAKEPYHEDNEKNVTPQKTDRKHKTEKPEKNPKSSRRNKTQNGKQNHK